VGLTLGDKMFVNHGLYLRSALEEVKWIDEDRYQFYHADGDLCLKLWQNGYKVMDSRHSFVEHFTHANRTVRKENMVLQQNDWQAYLSRWKNIYYIPPKSNTRDWLYLDYSDNTGTVSSFPLPNRLAALINFKISYMWSKYIKPIIRKLRGKMHG